MRLIGVRVSEDLLKAVERHLKGSRYHSKSQLFEEILAEFLARKELEDPYYEVWVLGKNPMDGRQIEHEYRVRRLKEEILSGRWKGFKSQEEESLPEAAEPDKKPRRGKKPQEAP